jgi:hypothetical protein
VVQRGWARDIAATSAPPALSVTPVSLSRSQPASQSPPTLHAMGKSLASLRVSSKPPAPVTSKRFRKLSEDDSEEPALGYVRNLRGSTR